MRAAPLANVSALCRGRERGEGPGGASHSRTAPCLRVAPVCKPGKGGGRDAPAPGLRAAHAHAPLGALIPTRGRRGGCTAWDARVVPFARAPYSHLPRFTRHPSVLQRGAQRGWGPPLPCSCTRTYGALWRRSRRELQASFRPADLELYQLLEQRSSSQPTLFPGQLRTTPQAVSCATLVSS
jgi:hypothetical protein